MLLRDDGSPVRYDPCAPIHVEVNPATAPPGADRLMSQALDAVGEAAGLVLVDDGTTSDQLDEDVLRSARTDGDTAPPVLVQWSDPGTHPSLEGDTAGRGGSETSWDGQWFETGAVLLDGPQLERELRGGKGAAAVRAVIMHELAHVLGLEHVDDPVELMYPQARPGVTSFGPGDRIGLAQVGSGGCRDY